MATTTIKVLVTADPADPFRYGWRDIERRDAEGAISWERQPLTLRDVLHPQEGDHVTQNEAHEHWCRYLAYVLAAELAGDPTAVVLHDMRIAWDVPDLEPHGPDIAVILGVPQLGNRSTFDVAAEGARPALIIEVTSPSTARVDRAEKRKEYEQARVPRYIIVDAVRGRRWGVPRLLGYELVGGRYQPLAPDTQGRLALTPVPLWLGVEGQEIVCFDAAGRARRDYTTERRARALAEQHAAAEAGARLVAEQHAAAEAGARAAVEARLAAVEAELRRLRSA